MKKSRKRKSKITVILFKHLNENIKEYIIIIFLFLIGIIMGTITINIINESSQADIIEYLSNAITSLSNNETDNKVLLLHSIKQNLFFVILLWFFGATGIGIVVVYILIIFKGYCISYTIASIIATFGIGKGLLFIISYLLLPNIILIPTIMFLAVKGIKLSKNILSNKFNENNKMLLFKHVMLLVIIIFIVLIVSCIEVFLCRNLLKLCAKYI